MTRSLALAHSTTAVQDSIAQRVQRLSCEARQLAYDHVEILIARMAAVAQTAAEVAEGGDAYPPGVRDLARRMAEDCQARAQTIETLLKRSRPQRGSER
jgi:hypothetical protein